MNKCRKECVHSTPISQGQQIYLYYLRKENL